MLTRRQYFGGGTVEMVINGDEPWHAKKDGSVHERLEEGTLPFHSIFALDAAMDVHEELYGPDPMKTISTHTSRLGKLMYGSLRSLRHANGVPVCLIYKDQGAEYGDHSLQAATIAFNIQRRDGSLVVYEEVEKAADMRQMYVRSGNLCNPGGVATYLEWTPQHMRRAYEAGHRCSKPQQVVMGRSTGVVRASLGAMSTQGDVTTLVQFIHQTYMDGPGPSTNVALVTLKQMADDPKNHKATNVKESGRFSCLATLKNMFRIKP